MLDISELTRSAEALRHVREQAVKEGVPEAEIDRAIAKAYSLVYGSAAALFIVVVAALLILNVAGVLP
ncbi:MAG: hypothetical protein HYW33_00700 [Candidatus Blackburnbacteria bacterium]|nr:hypothetical protein [Candidatus Blackburnbacteria bacterium]